MKKIICTALACLLMLFALTSCAPKKIIDVKPDILQIHNICELATLECIYQNVAEINKSKTHFTETDRKMWIEYTGIAKVGVDIEDIKMSVNGTVVNIEIPEPTVLSKEYDEKSFIHYANKDRMLDKNAISADEQNQAIAIAQNEMVKNIMNNKSLLNNSSIRVKALIENYINQIGELSGIEYTINWGNSTYGNTISEQSSENNSAELNNN